MYTFVTYNEVCQADGNDGEKFLPSQTYFVLG